jgi:methyl-accepting chemotaxis protein
MLLITGLVILLVFVANILGRIFHLFDHSHGLDHIVPSYQIEENFSFALNILVLIPVLLLCGSYVLYRVNKNSPYIPYLLTLALTFGSISIISGGSGRVEFHFSIFMVVAALGYYQNIKLLSLMTTIFAVHHLLGFFFFPEIVFGVHSYTFLMLILHATFLILTSSAVIWQVYSSKRIENDLLKKQEEQRKRIIEEIVDRLSFTSNQILILHLHTYLIPQKVSQIKFKKYHLSLKN